MPLRGISRLYWEQKGIMQRDIWHSGVETWLALESEVDDMNVNFAPSLVGTECAANRSTNGKKQ